MMARTSALLLLLLLSPAVAEPEDSRLNHGDRKVDRDKESFGSEDGASKKPEKPEKNSTEAGLEETSTEAVLGTTSTNDREDGDHTCKVVIRGESLSLVHPCLFVS